MERLPNVNHVLEVSPLEDHEDQREHRSGVDEPADLGVSEHAAKGPIADHLAAADRIRSGRIIPLLPSRDLGGLPVDLVPQTRARAGCET